MTCYSVSRRLTSLGIHAGVLAMVCSGATAADAEQGDRPLVRVRSNDPSIAAVIQQAAERSPLFRRLMATIDATDGLVYVDEGKCGHSVSACLTLSVKVAGPYRLLRILVDPQKRQRDCDLMASIGHELRHAIELLGEPNIRDYRAAFSFFEREGPTDREKGRFETAAAVRTGLEVGVEACAPAAATVAPPISRVRSSDHSIIALIERAAAQSPTFKQLLTMIESGDGIVYVEPGKCGHGVRACLLMWVKVSGPYRFLRIMIDRQKDDSDVDSMASVGHELQHALEALTESGVTNGDSLYNFFRRYAPTDRNRFETTAAINAGDAIRDELRVR